MSADIVSFQGKDKGLVKIQVVQSRMSDLHLPALSEMLGVWTSASIFRKHP